MGLKELQGRGKCRKQMFAGLSGRVLDGTKGEKGGRGASSREGEGQRGPGEPHQTAE